MPLSVMASRRTWSVSFLSRRASSLDTRVVCSSLSRIGFPYADDPTVCAAPGDGDDMVYQIMAGEFKTKKATKEYMLKKGDIYTCRKGTTDIATNTSKGVGVHRIAMLIPA
jgi:hypothetical protein